MTQRSKAAGRSRRQGGENRNGGSNSRSLPHCITSAPTGQGAVSPHVPPAHGHVVGHTWVKHVRKSAHFFRALQGWGVDISDLEAAEALGVTTLELREQEESRTYRVKLATLRSKSIRGDWGAHEQLVLRSGHWVVTGGTRKGKARGPIQLALFSEART